MYLTSHKKMYSKNVLFFVPELFVVHSSYHISTAIYILGAMLHVYVLWYQKSLR